MPEPLMHFNIDIKLQRFDSALKNIVSAGDGYFPDCMNLMKKNPQIFPLITINMFFCAVPHAGEEMASPGDGSC
ncbi:hypothetical protein F2Q68_00007303 [Brassica cretica]|uniref:Uncharacterized protein n=1 Tax=Brassica cretica TaxID=69181 RepID=A0A8S9KUG0_BRACR|nr:hypothetical protein F2Q68_00007303 [Brassica cretica]